MPRSWVVGMTRTGVTLMLMCTVASACGPARLAAPPDPEFTSGRRARPTIEPVETVQREGATILPSDVEPDADGDEFDVDDLVIVDDTGSFAPNATGWERFDAAIERRLGSNPAVGVAVMVDGRLVHQAAFGDRIPGDPVAATDRFRIASISKTITAIVTMQMVDEGVLTMDEPVGHVLIDHLGLTSPDPDVVSITVRELLSHTTGFPQHEGTFFARGATSCTDAAMQGLASSVGSGSGFRYSNMNYCVLGILIEAVTGMAYERVVDERLLRPLGIGGMRMTSTYELGPDEVSHFASPNRNFMETLGAAGSWNATPTDLVTILNAIDHDTEGWKAISAEAAESMRYRIENGRPPSGYGLGLINYDTDSWGHTGTIENTHAMVLHQPDGVTWAVTVAGGYPGNTGNLRGIMRSALADAFA